MLSFVAAAFALQMLLRVNPNGEVGVSRPPSAEPDVVKDLLQNHLLPRVCGIGFR